jgi:protein SCO1
MMYQLKRVKAYAVPGTVITSFTVDPLRDSVSRLHEYAQSHEMPMDWNLLTGAKPDLYRFARKELEIIATDGDGGPDDFIHSDNLVLVDRSQRIRGYYNGTDEKDVDRLIHDIERLTDEK